MYFTAYYWTAVSVLIFIPFENTNHNTKSTRHSLYPHIHHPCTCRLSTYHPPGPTLPYTLGPSGCIMRPVAIFVYWVYVHCKNYTIIHTVMYTNLLPVFGLRTAKLPTTTRVPLCHTKVRGPWSRTNGAVVWPAKLNVQALPRVSIDN
jgi:hypothetical protein